MRELTTTITYRIPEIEDYINNAEMKKYIIEHRADKEDPSCDYVWNFRDYFGLYDDSSIEDPDDLLSDSACDRIYERMGDRFSDDLYPVVEELFNRVLAQYSNPMETE